MTDRELFTLIMFSAFIMIILSIGILVLYNVSKTRILKDMEEAHLKELEYKNQLLANGIEVQERERCRIAKDLHDDIGSKLSIVNLNVNLLKSTLKGKEEVGEIIDQIEHSLTESITRARDISHHLYPPILEKFGIQSALESLANEVSRTGILRVHVDIDHEWKQLEKSEELHIYRVIQELIHNTIKHAKASEVWIKSKVIDNHLLISYEDDGVGLKMDGNKEVGLGMSSIHTRIELLEGEIKLDDALESGYKVEFVI